MTTRWVLTLSVTLCLNITVDSAWKWLMGIPRMIISHYLMLSKGETSSSFLKENFPLSIVTCHSLYAQERGFNQNEDWMQSAGYCFLNYPFYWLFLLERRYYLSTNLAINVLKLVLFLNLFGISINSNWKIAIWKTRLYLNLNLFQRFEIGLNQGVCNWI